MAQHCEELDNYPIQSLNIVLEQIYVEHSLMQSASLLGKGLIHGCLQIWNFNYSFQQCSQLQGSPNFISSPQCKYMNFIYLKSSFKNNWCHGYLYRMKTADRIKNVDQVQNVDCRLQSGYKMQTENLKSFSVWFVTTCHFTTYRASRNRFSAVRGKSDCVTIFHDYQHYFGIFLAIS